MKTKWIKEKVFIEQNVGEDVEKILNKKGFTWAGDLHFKIVYEDSKMTKGFEYEIRGWGTGHHSIFKFPLHQEKKYIIENLIFYGHISNRKQFIKMLEHYF